MISLTRGLRLLTLAALLACVWTAPFPLRGQLVLTLVCVVLLVLVPVEAQR